MRTVVLCPRAKFVRPSSAVEPCTECHEEVVVEVRTVLEHPGCFPVCIDCAAGLFSGEVDASGRTGVVVDPNVEFAHRAAFGRDLARYHPRRLLRPSAWKMLAEDEEDAHARWLMATLPTAIHCPRCSAYRGERCTGPWHCDERILENYARLEDLPTWGREFTTPCCGERVWLVSRTVTPFASWTGVPCRGCEKTYLVDRVDDDSPDADELRLAERIEPDRVEAVGWGLQ